jgi:hypothetical protein
MMDGELKLLPPWKNAVAELFSGRYGYGDVVPHKVIHEALSLPKPKGKVHVSILEKWRLALMTQMEQLERHLLEKQNMCLANVYGQGYRILKPGEQTAHAIKHGHHGIKKSIRKMGKQLSFVARDQLTSDQAKENTDALNRLSALKSQVKKVRLLDFDEQTNAA